MKLQITINGKIYEAEVEVLEEEEMPPEPVYPPYQPPPVFQPAPAVQAAAPVDDYVGTGNVCRSPVSGLVIRVNVVPGQAVQANDLVMVLEAMKMETNVTAPFAGTVKSIRLSTGDSVKAGQVLVEFE